MGSYNRNQCQIKHCGSFIYDGCTVCPSCSESLHLCELCGADKDFYAVGCLCNSSGSDKHMTDDMQHKIDTCDAFVNAIEAMTIVDFTRLPLEIRNVYIALQSYTPVDGFKVNR